MKIDWWLILPCVLLLALGLTVLRSVAPDQLSYQLLFTAVSIVVYLVVSTIDYKILLSLHLPIYISSIIFLLAPFVFGSHSRGALRWLQFGQISVQPSELIKPFLFLTFAYLATIPHLAHRRLLLVAAFLLPSIIIFFQPDLGTVLVIAVGWLAIFISLIPPRWTITGIVIGLLVLTPVTWFILKPYQQDRLLTFVNPYSDPLGRGYHVIQSTIAVGSGQFWGRGLGHGTQSQLRFLPERHTDFIFASLSEELGFFGSILTLLLYFIFFRRVYHLSQLTADPAAALFCLAVLAMLTFQIFINVGMNMGLAPVTGITLPFLSYGGSSLVSLAVTLGLLTSISSKSSKFWV